MNQLALGDHVFARDAHVAFAELSGDRNPIHVDPVYARRQLSGEIIVHGVHTLLAGLEAYVTRHRRAASSLRRLRVKFPSFVRVGERVAYVASENDPHGVRLKGLVSGRVVMSASLAWSNEAPPAESVALRKDAAPDAAADLSAEAVAGREGALALTLDEQLAERMFPAASIQLGPGLLADLLAYTRLVGMVCPGLRSLFSGLDVELVAGAARQDLRYRVTSVDPRFALASIEVEGACSKGVLQAFVRPEPRRQAAYEAVHSEVGAREFEGQRALIVGGSRGLGEATAKIVAAGGGDVLLTYRLGAGDAEAVREDIERGGGRCRIGRLSVDSLRDDLSNLAAQGFVPTHVYYFATPPLTRSVGNRLDEATYSHYAKIYVAGFATLYDEARRLWPGLAGFFYPSTVAVHDRTPDLLEYAAAKAAGEDLCRKLAERDADCRIAISRLPLVATDLTNSVLPVEGADAVHVMLAIVRDMQHGDCGRPSTPAAHGEST